MKKPCSAVFIALIIIITHTACDKKPDAPAQGLETDDISDISITGYDADDFPYYGRKRYDGYEMTFDMGEINGESFPLNWPEHWPDYMAYQPLAEWPDELIIWVGSDSANEFHSLIYLRIEEYYSGELILLRRKYLGQEDIVAGLLSGDTPDIVDLGGLRFFDFNKYNFFMDLNVLIDEDRDIERDGFYENILRAFETDGHLYYLAPCVKYDFVKIYVDYYARLPAYIREKDTLTVEEMLSIYNGMVNAADGELPFIYSNQLKYASEYLTFGSNEYIDYKERYWRFGPDYADKLTRLIPFEPDYTDEYYRYKGNRFENIKSFFYIFPYDFTRLLDILPEYIHSYYLTGSGRISENANTDGPDNHVGRWILDGSRKGDVFNVGSSVMGIPMGTGNKDLAWEYIKFALINGPQHNNVEAHMMYPQVFWGHSIYRRAFFSQMYNEATRKHATINRIRPVSGYDALVDVADWLDARNGSAGTLAIAANADMARARAAFMNLQIGAATADSTAGTLDAYFAEVFE